MCDASFVDALDAALRTNSGLAFSGAVNWTYAALRLELDAQANRPAALGVNPGDVVATSLPSDARHAVLILSLLRRGAVVCPMDPALPEAVLDGRLASIRAAFLLTADAAVPLARQCRCEHGPAVLVFTSGSSAEPKAALLPPEALLASAALSNTNILVTPGDRWLLSLPLYHVSGLGILFRCLLAGATVHVPNPGESLEQPLHGSPITHLSLVPMQLRRLLDTPSGAGALSRTKAVLLGGAPMPPRLVRRAAEHGVPLHTSYGLTEMASQVATTRPNEPIEGLLTSGYPLAPDTVAFTPEGEILVNGRQRFAGYWVNGSLERPFSDDGWYATRDLGFLDDSGRLVVTGRKDNMFVCGGENVQPEEIERHLTELDGVASAVVVPVENPALGYVPVAYVRTHDGRPPDAEAVLSALGAALPRYMIPRTVLAMPEAPEAARGLKIARAWLKRRAEDDFRRADGTP